MTFHSISGRSGVHLECPALGGPDAVGLKKRLNSPVFISEAGSVEVIFTDIIVTCEHILSDIHAATLHTLHEWIINITNTEATVLRISQHQLHLVNTVSWWHNSRIRTNATKKKI